MALSKSQKTLSDKAKENAQVTKGTSKNQTVLKKGVPNDHSPKHLGSAPVVGMSLGTTMNMGDYESLRADVWLTDSVLENETFEQAYSRINRVVSETLQAIVNKYAE